MSNSYIVIPRLTALEFCAWVGDAAPGDRLEYHRGFLACDIAGSELKALRLLARRAAWTAERGLVHLVQCRRGPGYFSYLAIRRPLPRRPRCPGSTRADSVIETELDEAA